MIEYSKQIADKWNIPVTVSEQVCNAFVRGDSPYFLSEYHLELSSELSVSVIWEIYDFLTYLSELGSKKKRVLNAYVKANMVTSDIEKRVNLTTSSFELDDLLMPVRPNARSRGQLALNKGLKPLADKIQSQTEEILTVEDLAAQFLEQNSSFKNIEEVLQGVKDIIAEQIAYDETIRAMAREFAFEDGFFEVVPKNKKDANFVKYVDRNLPVLELSNEELLKFFKAEDEKLIRFKLGVQLFRITELFRHHVITNPDSTSFDLLCETIDDSWLRLLQPIIERDVKIRFKENAERWATRQIAIDFDKLFMNEVSCGPILLVDATNSKQFQFIAVRSTGELLGTTSERKNPEGKNIVSERLKQFLGRYKTDKILLIEANEENHAETLLKQAFVTAEALPEFIRYTPENVSGKNVECEWISKEFGNLLDDATRKLYSDTLRYLKPLSLLPKVGVEFYTIHPLQSLLKAETLLEIIARIQTAARLKIGVPIRDILDSPIKTIPAITEKQLLSIKAADAEGVITCKNDLLKIPGMNDLAFRNVSGFIVIPNADELLDRTVVHPDYFEWFSQISEQLNVSVESIITEPDYLHSVTTDVIERKIFIEQHLINHLAAARRFLQQPTSKVRKKFKLTEVTEGAIVSGRVTNITQFGVFVNINAVCDGLIHISQLADEYVETPDQVVSVNDRVDVRILKVDVKKRRISLSMRNLGTMAPKVRPSKGQLDNLSEFFKNR